MRTTLLAVLSLAASGCVHVNMPDHLVSDSVDAGKDAVHAIARKLEARPKFGFVESNSRRTSFWLAQQGSADETVGQLQQRCVTEIVTQMQLTTYSVSEQKLETTRDGLVVRCRVDATPLATR
jgi:hypothetical protein